MSDKILVKYKVLEDIGDNINSLNDIIGNVIAQIRKLGYQWQFDGLDRLEHPEINKLEENIDSLLHKGGNTPEKLKELEMDLKRVVQKFYDADYQGVNVNISPDGSNMFGPKAPLPNNPNAKIKEAEHTGIVNGENKVKGVLEKGAILGPGLLMANDFIYGIANNGSTLLRGKDLDNQVKTDIDRQDAFVSEVKDVGGLDLGGAFKAADGVVSSTDLYAELNKITDTQARYEYLLDKAKTMDVSTEKNGAIFYAGRIESKSGIVTAREMAESYADKLCNEKGIVKLTLERTTGGKWMDNFKLYNQTADGVPKYEELGLTRQQTDKIWRTLSSRYANGTSGAITAFAKNVPDLWKPKTIFWSTELPQLRSNLNITHINIR